MKFIACETVFFLSAPRDFRLKPLLNFTKPKVIRLKLVANHKQTSKHLQNHIHAVIRSVEVEKRWNKVNPSEREKLSRSEWHKNRRKYLFHRAHVRQDRH